MKVLDEHIELTPEVRNGKPRIAGTRITVADVVIMHWRMGQSLDEIAGKYNFPLAAARAAMVYYYDHREEIDESINQDQAFAEALRHANPSLLQKRLKALQNG